MTNETSQPSRAASAELGGPTLSPNLVQGPPDDYLMQLVRDDNLSKANM